MTLNELTIERYNNYADSYISRAEDFRIASQEADQWWKPKIKKHWLFLLKMSQFYVNNAKDELRRTK